MANTGFTFDYYCDLIREILLKTHSCPDEVITRLADEYQDVITACWKDGVPAGAPAKLLYADWKVFHSQ